jgi:hypothetical protein
MHNLKNPRALTLNHVSAAFVLGTTSTYTTTVTTAVSINGKFGTTLGAQTNTASPTTDAVTGLAFPSLPVGSGDTKNGRATVVVAGVNAAGAIKYCQGSIVKTALGVTTTAGAFIDAPQFPVLPDDFAPLAYFLVRNSPSAAAWTLGTSNWTASGITCSTPVNVSTLPDRPQTA